MQALTLNTVVLHNDARATNNLAGVTLLVDLAKASPGTEDFSVTDLDEIDLVFSAEGFDELDVFGFRAGLDEHTKVSLALVEGLSSLAKTTSETVVNKGILQNLLDARRDTQNNTRSIVSVTNLKSILDGKLALGSSLGGNLDLSRGVDWNFISSVRHPTVQPAQNHFFHKFLNMKTTYFWYFEIERV